MFLSEFTENQPALFQGVEKQHHKKLFATGQRIELGVKENLFQEGECAQKCFLVLSGNLKLTKLSDQGKEIIIRYIGPSEMAAIISVMKEKTYPVTAVAIKPTEIIAWKRDAFRHLMYQYPDIALNMLDMVIDRIGDVQHRYFELSCEMVEQRIARTLIRLSQQAGKNVQDGIYIDMPLTRQDIADFCGTTIYTASRLLNMWQKRGLIQCSRKSLTIMDLLMVIKIAESHGEQLEQNSYSA